jgi:hypothetical protein
VETEPTFECPGCRFDFCRKCQLTKHTGAACETKAATSERISEEEMASNRAMCQCPDCGAKFVKDAGCNKMKCRCGALVCFVCREKIAASVGYKHFCEHPTDPGQPCPRACGKCSLWASS